MEDDNKEVKTSRRKILKKTGKAALFVIPTVMTFKVADLHAQASSTPTTPGW